MKHVFKKLHKGSNHETNRTNETPIATSPSSATDHGTASVQASGNSPASPSSLPSIPAVPAGGVPATPPSAVSNLPDYISSEEEFQVQLALAISASNSDFHGDPETDQIRAATLLSLGNNRSDSATKIKNEDAEALSRQYWEYNLLDYEEKVVDGFYDIYGISSGSAIQEKMPSLADLELSPCSTSFEVIVVNRKIDRALEELVQIAQCIADFPGNKIDVLVQRLAELVTEHMGGPVLDATIMFARWMEQSTELRTSLHTSLLPIGSINIGLSRHRALLFKVLADSIRMPCRLLKGSHYTGFEDDAVNIIKLEDERDYLVDLMAAPGTLIPADILSSKDTVPNPYNSKISQIHHHCSSSFSELASSRGKDGGQSSLMMDGTLDPGNMGSVSSLSNGDNFVSSSGISSKVTPKQFDNISSSAIGKSQYKGGLAFGSGTRMNVNVIPYTQKTPEDSNDLFADLNPFKIKGSSKNFMHHATSDYNVVESQRLRNPGRPPVPLMWKNRHACNEVPKKKENDLMGVFVPQNSYGLNHYNMSISAASSSNVSVKVNSGSFTSSHNLNMPVKHANTTEFASSSTKGLESVTSQPSNMATSVDEQSSNSNGECTMKEKMLPKDKVDMIKEHEDCSRFHDRKKDAPDRFWEPNLKFKAPEKPSSSGTFSSIKVVKEFDDVDVGECEIAWEDLVLGERIGLGSYGEVYRADWNGMEVAVKKFLDQDFSGPALAEFKREVLIMRQLRHPNVVLFVGAVTRTPNLSIITEFIPRGSLYRIIHHPHCPIDERRRIKMALDVAQGMNCLHTSRPTIVHRDLKSPNLLVDENWNVKVGDFGLSRLKHHTFLSSKSTGGTPEWMAPEVLRNEPSNEKCDVYSFGVILWELATLRLPWSGMNPMQVVGAVGFQNRRLEIPKEVDPGVAKIIWECWQTDPNLRPSFAQLSEALNALQRLAISSQLDQSSSALLPEISVNSTP